MNVTFIIGNDGSLGLDFDDPFASFCRRKTRDVLSFPEKHRMFAESLKVAVDAKKSRFCFSDFDKFMDNQISGFDDSAIEKFFGFAEKFLAEFIDNHYYGNKMPAFASGENAHPEYTKSTPEWFVRNFRESLKGLFSRAVFSELSYRRLRGECSYQMRKRQEDGEGADDADVQGLVSKNINYSVFNFNHGDLLWKCVLSHFERDTTGWERMKTHEADSRWTVTGNRFLGDFEMEEHTVYVHGKGNALSYPAETDACESVANAISRSQIICIYGMSLENPAYGNICSNIMKRLKDRHVTLVIFDDCDAFRPRESLKRMYYKLSRMNRYMEILDKFVDKTSGDDGIWDYKDRIHLAYNRDIFSFDWYLVDDWDWGPMYFDNGLYYDSLGKD